MVAKTQKELAFLRDLAVDGEWTQRFVDLVDKHLDLTEAENMLYVNAGTGTHALAIQEKFGTTTSVFAYCENDEILKIAQDKAIALGADVDFSTLRFDNDAFDAVLADASLIRPAGVEDFVEDVVRVARTSGDVAVFLPTAGSFGEVVSLLWEVFFNEDLGEHGAAAERLITDIPTVSRVEEIAARAGLVNVNSETVTEVFEYENGTDFISAPLIADFLLPLWLEMLSDEEKEQIPEKLAQLIDAEDRDLTFRFSVKATLVSGEKE
jgi:ubiquinone/menaquinone biosynthesis C-methylase UbiE